MTAKPPTARERAEELAVAMFTGTDDAGDFSRLVRLASAAILAAEAAARKPLVEALREILADTPESSIGPNRALRRIYRIARTALKEATDV